MYCREIIRYCIIASSLIYNVFAQTDELDYLKICKNEICIIPNNNCVTITQSNPPDVFDILVVDTTGAIFNKITISTDEGYIGAYYISERVNNISIPYSILKMAHGARYMLAVRQRKTYNGKALYAYKLINY